MNVHRLILVVPSLILLAAASAADWPQWRGPQRNGISKETGLLQEWPKSGPKLVWQATDLGSGYSTPAVVGERLFVLGNEGEDNEFVEARRVEDGKKIWSTRIGKVGRLDQSPSYPGARSTPTVEGDVLYALGSDGDLVCLSTTDGKPRWSKNVRTEFTGKPGEWAYSESPLVDGELVVCTPGGSEATLLAVNKNTGDVVWKCAVPGGDEAAYASIIVTQAGGVRQYVQFLGKRLVGVEAETGKLLWQYGKTAEGSPANIPTPVAHDGYVYSATGRGGAGLVKIKAEGGRLEADEVYFTPKLPTSIGGAVLIGDYLYGTTRQAVVCAAFATGEIRWTERGVAPGSVCYADGRLYVHGESGEVLLLEATPEAYREKGRFTPANQPDRGPSKAWAYPVVANGRLYLRDANSLWCYDVQAKDAE